MMFHGAFKKKADAKRKEKKVHGFIQPRNIEGERRYVVMSERKNPIKRKKKTARNPHELMIMGANPTLRAGMSALFDSFSGMLPVKVLSISGDAVEVKFKQDAGGYRKGETTTTNVRHVVPRGAVHRRKYGTTIGHYDVSENPHEREISIPAGSTIIIRTPRQNPSAESIRESFTGTPVEWETTADEPHMPAGDYAQLGELLALYVKPHRGEQVQEIKFTRPRPLLVTDESARQLYFVGGDQDVTESLSSFTPHHRGGNIHELGELRRIDYKQRKEHVPNPELDEWRHHLGEETGERPRIVFDANHKRLLLEGGAYVVRPEGIVN